MEAFLIGLVIGFVVHWLLTMNQRRILKQYRSRERWMGGFVKPVE